MQKPDIEEVEKAVEEFLETLNLDLDDPNLQETPHRIAKSYVNELFCGLYDEEPQIKTFPNEKEYDQMVVTGPIQIKSMCSHHFLPFVGTCFVGYIPDKELIGLSKFSRIVKWFARRPQIQEGLTDQIVNYIEQKMDPIGCGVFIEAQHNCMKLRGVNEPDASMVTTALRGAFMQENTKSEFLKYIPDEIR